MAKKIVWEWEEIDQWTTRVKVHGGWLVHVSVGDAKKFSTSVVFVHDPDWQWQPIEPYVDPQVVKANLAKEFESTTKG